MAYKQMAIYITVMPVCKVLILNRSSNSTFADSFMRVQGVTYLCSIKGVRCRHRFSFRHFATRIHRKNAFNIPMIPESLRKVLFRDELEPELIDETLNRARRSIKSIVQSNDFDDNGEKFHDEEQADGLEKYYRSYEYDDFPKLKGRNLSEHFSQIADDLTRNYSVLLKNFASSKDDFPEMPKQWIRRTGWTKYGPEPGQFQSVPYPSDDIFVLDVEVCISAGQHPIMATAMSKNAWYSWCSSRLEYDHLDRRVKNPFDDLVTVGDLIPVETHLEGSYDTIDQRERIIIGHNVGFDRTFLKEQYFVQGTKMRFFDTMSAHIAVSGLAGDQRIEFQYHKTGRHTKAYAEATEYDKRRKKDDDSKQFQVAAWLDSTSMNNLADVHEFYCRKNSKLKVNKEQRSMFTEGRLEDIRDESNFQQLMTYCATDVAATYEIYRALAGLFFERFPSPVTLCGMLEMSTSFLTVNDNWLHYLESANQIRRLEERRVKKLLSQQCDKACSLMQDRRYESDLWMFDEDWSSQGSATFTKKSVKNTKKKEMKAEMANKDEVKFLWNDCKQRLKKNTPLLVGFPTWYRNLCKEAKHAVKSSCDHAVNTVEKLESWDQAKQNLLLLEGLECGPSSISVQKQVTPKLLRLHWDNFPLFYTSKYGWGYVIPREDSLNYLEADPTPTIKILRSTTFSTIKFPLKELVQFSLTKSHEQYKRLLCHMPSFEKLNVVFAKLPHKDGPEYNVGNPLAKDFIHFIERNVLSSENASHAHLLADLTKVCSYWKNNSDRIHNLLVVWLTEKMAPNRRNISALQNSVGIILPRLVVAGTVTRRAVEPTWMTVSNAKKDRIGSELKGMIQAPDGFSFVGADVDSQEMWIAGLLADSSELKVHVSQNQNVKTYAENANMWWKNGSESDLFNCLERIARSDKPTTPVLKCRISRSLEPDVVGEKFLPSRINWIIQSSAVDFLHSLLTCMRWLCNEYKINARFALSVHDEVRYLVEDKDKYRAALALQLTNLLTRSFFVHSVGMRDLPLTVAYFSRVDIDRTFRKEVDDDCVTPSNPLGLETCYNIPKGEALTMRQLIAKTGPILLKSD